jgi:hypothetical protein
MNQPPKLVVIWPVGAKLLDKEGTIIATCLDTPNAIGSALEQVPEAMYVKSYGEEIRDRSEYANRRLPENSHYDCCLFRK